VLKVMHRAILSRLKMRNLKLCFKEIQKPAGFKFLCINNNLVQNTNGLTFEVNRQL